MREADENRGPVEEACAELASRGWHVMPAAALSSGLATDDEGWARFAAHWEKLETDIRAAESGTLRQRRSGHFSLSRTGEITALPPQGPAQQRRFEPLTDDFRSEPLLAALIRALGEVAATLVDADEWSVEVHPFRVVAEEDHEGEPAPGGKHPDEVVLASSLLVERRNAVGGECTVYGLDGGELLRTTLSEPGTLLLADDRTTLRTVSPILPLDTTLPARRDVLTTTFTPRGDGGAR